MDGVLTAARGKGLLKSAGRARTDSSHVLSSARELCWLEQAAESLRAALNALAQAAPDWLTDIAEPDWFRHYATRTEDSRFPGARVKREEVGTRIGRDGTRLLEAVFAADAPAALRALDEVEILRRVWVQHFHRVDGVVTRRGPKDRPPGAMRLVSPYDPEARAGVKRDNTSSQAKGAFGLDAFTIDWDHQQVACPGGVTAASWYPRTDSKGLPVIQVRFPVSLCGPCPYLRSCVSSPTGRRRELMLRRQQAEHDAIRAIRREQQTDAWKERYKIRAGVEGPISQAVGRCGLRRSRYRGLTKTSIQHQLAGAAINLARIDAHLTGTPRARTRTSHFAALCPVELTLDGAQQGPN